MKKYVAILGLLIATGSMAQAQEQGKISFFECHPTSIQSLRFFTGNDEKLISTMIDQGQCSLATDLGFENTAKALRDPESKGERLISVNKLPSNYNRIYCDGEDLACMKAQEVNRIGEADIAILFLNPTQFRTISDIADDGIAMKHAKKSIYFIADKSNKYVPRGEGYDGKQTVFNLTQSVLLIK